MPFGEVLVRELNGNKRVSRPSNSAWLLRLRALNRHCEERSDEAIFQCLRHVWRLLRCARNDGFVPKGDSQVNILRVRYYLAVILEYCQLPHNKRMQSDQQTATRFADR